MTIFVVALSLAVAALAYGRFQDRNQGWFLKDVGSGRCMKVG
ncbi:hypothetical protein PKO51_06970 [Yokenella regensburgei]|nr:hypothetical protein [Yokenella regensburgei]MDQ4429101.1 hypothetical protein [Yokenella regensburgei]